MSSIVCFSNIKIIKLFTEYSTTLLVALASVAFALDVLYIGKVDNAYTLLFFCV